MGHVIWSESIVRISVCRICINGIAAGQAAAESIDAGDFQRLRPHVGRLEAYSVYRPQRRLNLQRIVVGLPEFIQYRACPN